MIDPIKRYYNETRVDYGINSLRRKKILNLAFKNDLSGKRILDIGCASGYLARELKRQDNFVAGIDISEKFADQLKKEIDYFSVLDVERGEWPDDFLKNKFDLIISAELLEHLFDQDNFLIRLKELLKPSGQIIITTPNFLIWNNRLRMLLGRYGAKEILFDEGHIHLLSYCGLKEKIKKCGFKIIGEDNIWYPNKLEKIKKFLPPNLFVFQTIIKIKNNYPL